ncbi:major facilitator protein [Xanthomonas arboricola pv. pruni str. MAFF 311562]|uniref:Major facilitator protein n=1 Tax=Xanthomonas arboricola pv. pruni str. MAFF 311562 TaxID=1414836 RepID=W4S0U4_9XANT|nr:major facilitator protein [Xanthomonas arboricola pv. pruni str. MAFF 311562]GAE59620.1 major facilitator superfamily protein [Xanthomonas arboricola pv. pruni MAFF 301427]
MTQGSTVASANGADAGLLSKERIVARPGFNRWLVPPAALAIHLCIGMAYGFSVFWLPLSKALGITEAIACPADMGLFARMVATTCDWKISELQWMYTLFFVLLGCSAAIWGGWLERAGPRKAGVVSALCWCGGLVISAAGIHFHQIWMLWLGSGVIGGIGLGLGYISPVSTLIKWFPDRRGMATGMAIMGFGGGAMIGSPLADALMRHFATPTSVGVLETFLVMAALYFVFMMAGAFGYRVPPSGWTPAGWTAPVASNNAMITANHVHVSKVWGIPQFWLLWGVLCLNVSAGIGVIGMSSPMLQEVFGGRLIGVDVDFGSWIRRSWPASRPSRPASPACSACSTSAGASSGPACPTSSAARTPTRCSSCWASACTRLRRRPAAWAASRCSRASSASSCRCTAAASPPSRHIWPTCSAPRWSAPSTAAC